MALYDRNSPTAGTESIRSMNSSYRDKTVKTDPVRGTRKMEVSSSQELKPSKSSPMHRNDSKEKNKSNSNSR